MYMMYYREAPLTNASVEVSSALRLQVYSNLLLRYMIKPPFELYDWHWEYIDSPPIISVIYNLFQQANLVLNL